METAILLVVLVVVLAVVFDFLNGAARRVLGLYSRDESGPILWRLALRQPRLLLLALRSILTSGPFSLTLSGRKAGPAVLSDKRD